MHNEISYKNRWINIIFVREEIYYPYKYFFATFNMYQAHLSIRILCYAHIIYRKICNFDKICYIIEIYFISTRDGWSDDARLKEAQNQW